MDNEADIILEDTISFCQRDDRDERLINMLRQSRARSLTGDELTIEAPSRFAYSYLMKQRKIIERYLEEIAFCPLSMHITVSSSVTGDIRGDDVSRETLIESDSQTGAAPLEVEGMGAAGIGPEDAVAIANDSEKTIPTDSLASGEESPAKINEGAPGSGSAGQMTSARASAVALKEAPRTTSRVFNAGETVRSTKGVTITNTLSQDEFRSMMSNIAGPAKNQSKPKTGDGGATAGKRDGDSFPSVPVNSKFTFENFVYGEENKQAYQSALRFAAVAEDPSSYTSLFIYGNSGLGKTHLLLAIENYLAETKPYMRVKYANSQAYIDDFINEVAIQKKGGGTILRDYHAADILIIDDIQNIIGKTASIDYFFRLMEEFIRDNKKVVIASDRPPKKLGMDERLTSRFNGGMLGFVSEPGFEMKYAILKHYYENNLLASDIESLACETTNLPLLSSLCTGGGHLSDAQLRHMAEISGTNIRELESFCERCACDSYEKEQKGSELTGEDIEAIANEYFDTARKKIHIDTVQSVVEEFYHVSHEEMIGPRRTANIAFARHVAVYLSNELCEASGPAIGAEFGGRDHSTVFNSLKVVEKKMKNNRSLCEELQQLRNKIVLKS